MRRSVPQAALPSRKLRRAAGAGLLLIISLVALIAYLGVDPLDLFTQFHYVVDLASNMFPPNISLFWQKQDLFASFGQTISMAFLGTLFGGTVAVVLAFFAATSTSPNRWLRLAIRTLFAVERSIPTFVVLLVLLIAVGIGPFAGMIALSVGSVGMFGKLFADAVEQVDFATLEAIEAVGGTRLQLIRYGILPEVAPSFVANSLYAFDVNLRAAIPLGVFGGGGIGFELNIADRVLRYRDMLAYTLLIVVLIIAMEKASDFVRKRIFA